ncbi:MULTISPECIES: energy-coupling factor ABC transporter substrate-binding protein [Paenibacillus]|uniref:Cobalt transport protein CbiN n=1 Tax=Paenibacillus radicis (ex Xue et al. 2023) TaxID=2972489 RepID=A0ABT1YH44_9BACL|nr:energy-coupling factor ABC transporter substrate-binding protein [Paenibacillus radicis (ex Xue et al. 2023)]MCR8631543.1 energy-coupling factor ABC transporter substrate-binding protein [Paenibacillus radicis (ex Xue et al. 2023)]
MKTGTKNALIISAVILLAALPLLLVNGEFGGADGAAEEMIATLSPTYKPWFTPLLEPPAETESMLFALQAALGAGFIGYVIGLFKGRATKTKTQ